MPAFLEEWELIAPLFQALISLGISLLGALVMYAFRARVRLTYGRANNSRNVVFTPDSADEKKKLATEIYVDKYFLQNTGKKPATHVEFVLSGFPTDVSVYPPRDTQFKRVDKDGCLMELQRMAPGELVVIDCLFLNQPAAFVVSVKCAETLGKPKPFRTFRDMGQKFHLTAMTLMLLGIAFTVQILIQLAVIL